MEVVKILGFSPQQAKIVELILCGACDKQIALVPLPGHYFEAVFRPKAGAALILFLGKARINAAGELLLSRVPRVASIG